MDYMKRIGTAMVERGISQSELARKIGISPSTLNKAIARRDGLKRHIGVVAQVLGVSADWLLNGDADRCADASTEGYAAYGPGRFRLIGSVTENNTGTWDGHSRRWVGLPHDTVVVAIDGNHVAPGLSAGQLVVLDREGREPRNGDLVAVQIKGDKAYIKRFSKDARHGLLVLTGQDGSAPVVIQPDEIVTLRRVIGVLFEVPEP
jgi:transcriptional regulator with XRE-family HTH domain